MLKPLRFLPKRLDLLNDPQDHLTKKPKSLLGRLQWPNSNCTRSFLYFLYFCPRSKLIQVTFVISYHTNVLNLFNEVNCEYVSEFVDIYYTHFELGCFNCISISIYIFFQFIPGFILVETIL